MGTFPRVAYWDNDDRKDLLVGTAGGNIRIYLNVGTENNPTFDAGTTLQVGPPGGKVDIAVGGRATPDLVDWNNDGLRDLVSGSYGGKIYVFINSGLDSAPDYLATSYAQTSGGDLTVYGVRASPVIGDFDDDMRKDILAGNTYGQLLLYSNVGTDAAPLFDTYTQVEADSVPIDLAGSPRSRPYVCDWNDDGWLDVLIGISDGRVHLFLGQEDLSPVVAIPEPTARLLAPWPNPFNPRVTIAYELTRQSQVGVRIYDTTGRLVRSLVHRTVPAGYHRLTWKGEDQRGRPLPTGVYLLSLETPGHRQSQKLILVK